MSIEQYFEDLWRKVIRPDIEAIEHGIGVFLKAAESAVAKELTVEGLKIINDAVLAAERTRGTNAQKLAYAQMAAVRDLSIANLSRVSENTMNIAIEAVVAQLKTAKIS